jgi:hypothetical protein
MARVHFPMTHRFPPLCTNIPPTFQTPTEGDGRLRNFLAFFGDALDGRPIVS